MFNTVCFFAKISNSIGYTIDHQVILKVVVQDILACLKLVIMLK